jgi:pimeloyl-ACP methyl ester carboxylesterase
LTTWLNTPIQMQFRTIDGLSIRYAESQDQSSDHALLLSPWPESLLAFEPTWTRLAQQTHLVAVDLPGFGHSQRRDALLSPRAMGEFVIRVADAFGLEHPHVVGPDVGNGASLFAAALHPGRLRSLVVGTGGTARVANTLGARKTSAGRRRRTGGPGVQRAVRGRARNREEERTQMPSRASDRRR